MLYRHSLTLLVFFIFFSSSIQPAGSTESHQREQSVTVDQYKSDLDASFPILESSHPIDDDEAAALSNGLDPIPRRPDIDLNKEARPASEEEEEEEEEFPFCSEGCPPLTSSPASYHAPPPPPSPSPQSAPPKRSGRGGRGRTAGSVNDRKEKRRQLFDEVWWKNDLGMHHSPEELVRRLVMIDEWKGQLTPQAIGQYTRSKLKGDPDYQVEFARLRSYLGKKIRREMEDKKTQGERGKDKLIDRQKGKEKWFSDHHQEDLAPTPHPDYLEMIAAGKRRSTWKRKPYEKNPHRILTEEEKTKKQKKIQRVADLVLPHLHSKGIDIDKNSLEDIETAIRDLDLTDEHCSLVDFFKCLHDLLRQRRQASELEISHFSASRKRYRSALYEKNRGTKAQRRKKAVEASSSKAKD